MTLINCRECGKEISDTSKRCIHCGAKIKKEKIKKEKNKEVSKNKKKLILIILGIILIIGTIITIYFLLNNNVEQTNLRDDTKSQVEIITDYINIRENPNVSSDVLGKVYQGEIYTILSENNDSEYKWIEIETSNGIRGYISGVDTYVKRLYIPNNEEQPPIDNPIIDNNNTSNENNTNTNTNDNQKPNNNTNNNQKPNNNTNNNNNNNNENYTPQLKACLKTCDSGYVLKNEDSVDCYCEKIQQTYVAKNQVIYNNEGVKITAKGIDYSDRNFITFDLLVENNSDIPKVIQRNHFSYVNGYDMATVYSVTLQPGTKSTNGLSYLRSTLSKNGITEINSIKIDFVIIDWDGNGLSTGKRRVTSDWININF